jgi:hypothetical protein
MGKQKESSKRRDKNMLETKFAYFVCGCYLSFIYTKYANFVSCIFLSLRFELSFFAV